MKLVAALTLSSSLVALAAYAQQVKAADVTGPLTAELAAQLSQNVNKKVIVVMRNRVQGDLAARDQADVMSELHQVNAQHIKAFRLVNALAATVSEGEMARLKANPSVEMVAPDMVIHHAVLSPHELAVKTKAAAAAAGGLNTLPGSCPNGNAVQLNPEALLTTGTASPNPALKTERTLGIDGSGVRVAYIADGIDPQTPNLLRSNGKSVFIDYQDFSGDGVAQIQPGYDEAILDANSIAGQGILTFDISQYGPLSTAGASGTCNIRIQGVAPGAQLVGLDVFGQNEDTTESNFLEAEDYAVNVDHVDVLNESFGGNPLPDVTALDIQKLFNDAAVAAGVTVAVSSGDAGSTSTIGSPSSDPLVISAGASTTLREYAQTGYAGSRALATTGWLDDNISALSSAGFEESGRTVDLVAPGDLNWISCTAIVGSPYSCTNLFGAPSTFTDSGGTSESAPLTAGTAALVIEAYRNTHGGASPSPALVKQIITSAAVDLGIPANEQGSGILNTYNAVVLAESIHTKDGAPKPIGSGILLSQNQLNAVGMPNSPHSFGVTVTNTGAAAQTVAVAGRAFGPPQNVQHGSVDLAPGANPQFLSLTGAPENYATVSIKVPVGANRLYASIAYESVNGRAGQLSLIDPKGRFAAYTLPQGIGNFGAVDVRAPTPGTWTGVIFARGDASGPFVGSVQWEAYTQSFVPFATVSPSSLSLAPGQSGVVKVTATTPATAGDASGSIVFTPSGAGVDPYAGPEHSSVGVTLRSLVPLGKGGAFSGVLTGGNGRGSSGEVAYYEFNVPPNTTSISTNVSLVNDFGNNIGAYLIGPDGATRGVGQNNLGGINGPSLTANTLNPPAGTWTLVIDLQEPIVGDQVTQPFTGNILLNQVAASAPSLPTSASTTLPAGVPVTVPVTITNNGAAPDFFFVDARLNTVMSLPLASQEPPNSASGYTLPLTSAQPVWLVPTETSALATTATANVPIEYDYDPQAGDPDLYGAPTTANNAAGSYTPSGGTVTPGYWFASPTELGPYNAAAAAGVVNMTMTATMKCFDPAVASPTGDFWIYSTGNGPAFNPIVLNPGQSTTVDVTITPAGTPGTVVSGTLYVDDYMGAVPPYSSTAGNEVAGLNYTYTVGAAPAAIARR
jgi:hypothetical protein